MSSDNPFAMVPVEVFMDDRLSKTDIRVLGAILSFRNKETNLCWPSRDQIKRRCGLPLCKISTATTSLAELGWLKKEGNGGRSTHCTYKFSIPDGIKYEEKEKMFFVYMTTNTTTKQFYIGLHETINVDDGYYGSNIIVQSWDKKNLKKEVLFNADDRSSAALKEVELIKKHIGDPLCVNKALMLNEIAAAANKTVTESVTSPTQTVTESVTSPTQTVTESVTQTVTESVTSPTQTVTESVTSPTQTVTESVTQTVTESVRGKKQTIEHTNKTYKEKIDKKESADVSPSAQPKKSNGTRLPDDFEMPDEWIEWAINERTDLDNKSILIERDKFIDYWHSVAGAKARKADWFATWRNWVRSCRNTQTHHPPARQQNNKKFDPLNVIYGGDGYGNKRESKQRIIDIDGSVAYEEPGIQKLIAH